ncbi:MAG: hypothetical protein RLZZ546_3255, partial [Bacteroidota bacterium]
MRETKQKSFLDRIGKWGFAFALFFLMSAGLSAQVKVSGTIVDETGVGIPGVTVLEVGTTNGTISDIDGNYSLIVARNAKIQYSFTGYVSQEMDAGDGGAININMAPDNAILDEVVVTGYQIQRKRDISGAVAVVSMKEMKGLQTSSFTQVLAGRAPGVTVSTSGSPGDATNVRVRGISSFTSNDPLYIIDGIPIVEKFNNAINPNDIESIQVLKDASTASIYGSRASNGVIVVTTKRGKEGKVKMSYDGSYGVANPVKGFDKVLNTDSKTFVEAIRLKFAADPNNMPQYAKDASLPKYIVDINGKGEEGYDILNNPITLTNQAGTNWWQEMSRSAPINNHNLTVSGGTDKATFLISAGYLGQQGVLNHTYFNRGNLRANTTFKVGKRVRIAQTLAIARTGGVGVGSTGGQNNEQGVLGSLLKANPLVSVRDIKGNPGSNLANGLSNGNNPVAQLEQNKDNTRADNRVLGNVSMEVDLMSNLTFRSLIGTDIGVGSGKRFTFPNPYRNEGDKVANSFSESWYQNFGWNFTNTLNYNTKLGGDRHNLNFLVGQEAISFNGRGISGNLANYFTTDINVWYINSSFGAPGSRGVSSGGNQAKLASYFGKMDYSFDDKYFISGTIRRDGSSKFLSGVRYGVFPAASVAWRVSKESFLSDVSWLNDLKLRASYGELGNQNIRDYNFTDLYGSERIGQTFYDISGNNSSPATGYALTAYGNPNTVWETSKSTNFGFDLGLLNSFNVYLDIYKRNTSNLLYNPPLPGTAGAASAPVVNVGEMVNTGFDLGLNYDKRINSNLAFNAGINLARYKNEILKVSNDDKEFTPNDNLTERLPQSNSAFMNRVGYAISSFNGFEVEGLITTEAEKARQVGSAIGGL